MNTNPSKDNASWRDAHPLNRPRYEVRLVAKGGCIQQSGRQIFGKFFSDLFSVWTGRRIPPWHPFGSSEGCRAAFPWSVAICSTLLIICTPEALPSQRSALVRCEIRLTL